MDPARHHVVDVSADGHLLGYAARAQLALVREQASLTTVAVAAGMGRTREGACANLVNLLNRGALSDESLQRLDEIIAALAPQNVGPIAGLSSLAMILRGLHDRKSLAGRVPSSWTREILRQPADSEFEVITHASALISTFLAAEAVDKSAPGSKTAVRDVRNRYHEEIIRVVEQLILIGQAPPTQQNVDALIMLGTLGGYAFDIIKSHLEKALMRPLGFRVWRSIARLVKLIKPTSPYRRPLIEWVRRLLREQAEELRRNSLYPARCMDLELAIAIPPDWSPPDDDWAGQVLLLRANNASATVQERGTAAMGLWQRAVEQGRDRDKVRADLRHVISEFSTSNGQDSGEEMRWIADCLEYLVDNDEKVCNDWSQFAGRPWRGHVDRAARQLAEIPEEIVAPTVALFQHSLLQNAVSYRRRAIEALLAGGWTEPVTNALAKYLELEESEPWIRSRAEFALGFLERPDTQVEQCLTDACAHAYASLIETPTPGNILEMHSVLFSIGDCFGAVNVKRESVRRIRQSVHEILSALAAGLTRDADLYLVARAVAYVLVFTAQPREEGKMDLSEELLRGLCTHPDSCTKALSRWALHHLIDESTGRVLPLVRANL